MRDKKKQVSESSRYFWMWKLMIVFFYKNKIVKLQIWDTAGQERFRSITQSYYRSAHALILVYDISCQPTFDALTDWIREIQEYANPKVLKILVGNKTDREDREIPIRVGEEFAKQHDMYFLETSSKQGENGEIEKLPTTFIMKSIDKQILTFKIFTLIFQLNDSFMKSQLSLLSKHARKVDYHRDPIKIPVLQT
jgi:small GTP-binding protein